MEIELSHRQEKIILFIIDRGISDFKEVKAKFGLTDHHARTDLDIIKGYGLLVDRRGVLAVREEFREKLKNAFLGGYENERGNNDSEERTQEVNRVSEQPEPESNTDTEDQENQKGLTNNPADGQPSE